MSEVTVKRGTGFAGLRTLVARIGSVFRTIAAAGSAGNAVENGRHPSQADLVRLGMGGARFRQYY